jgi:hypothetical protein
MVFRGCAPGSGELIGCALDNRHTVLGDAPAQAWSRQEPNEVSGQGPYKLPLSSELPGKAIQC